MLDHDTWMEIHANFLGESIGDTCFSYMDYQLK